MIRPERKNVQINFYLDIYLNFRPQWSQRIKYTLIEFQISIDNISVQINIHKEESLKRDITE